MAIFSGHTGYHASFLSLYCCPALSGEQIFDKLLKCFLWTSWYYLCSVFIIGLSWAVWPDWAIYWTLGNSLKSLATIILPKLPTFLGNFCKCVKIFNFSSEIILGKFYRHLAIFFWSHWSWTTTVVNILNTNHVLLLRNDCFNYWQHYSRFLCNLRKCQNVL